MINNLKLAAAAIILALIVFATWYITRDHYQGITKNIQLDMAAAVQKELLTQITAAEALEAKRKTAEETHAKDQLTINHQRDQLASVHIDKICSHTLQPIPQPGTDPDRTAGVLSGRVDEEFAKLQSRISHLISRCDQLNIDAIQFNSSSH